MEIPHLLTVPARLAGFTSLGYSWTVAKVAMAPIGGRGVVWGSDAWLVVIQQFSTGDGIDYG